MSASFQEHLELALGEDYRVERELGGGGMSRVFLATEVSLGRPVVIKVLTPELAAGVNRERFRREVQLAAGLQHPMIVPLLSAGEAEGLLWYTMPFVPGESLRELIGRGVMSQRDALPILVDVAEALGAAHRKGIVHRDIKPGNILLHENHAVVADFGVAKALTAAVSESTGLTTSGLAVGTPAYMSPEQAAGEGTVDARSDIYSLGCVAYELLTGKPPFTDPSMARLLVAQVSQMPVPIQQVAPVRAGMAGIIMRCLEKDPEARWQTADELAAAFETQRYTSEPTPVPPEPSARLRSPTAPVPVVPRPAERRTRRGPLVGGAVVVAAVVVWLAMASTGKGTPTAVAFAAPQTIIVADVENRTADSTLGDLLSEALRTELQESKIVTVMTPGSTAAALERMQRPAATRVSSALAREIAVREGVPVVIEGRIQKVGSTYLVRAAIVSPADGAERSSAIDTAATENDLIAAVGRLARRTREKLGESRQALTALAPMEQVTTTSLDALRKYTEALRLADGTPLPRNGVREIELLEQAVRLDSTFAMAWRRLGVRLLNGGGGVERSEQGQRVTRGKQALTRAFELRDRLSPLERGLAEAAYYTEVTRDIPRATAAYQSILAEQPTNRIALNNLANNALQSGQFERVREYGEQYIAVDSTNLQAWPWALWGAYGTGRMAEARAKRAEMRRRFTTAAQVDALDDMDLNWLSVERDWIALEALARRRIASATTIREEDVAQYALVRALVSRGLLEASWKANDAAGARRLAGPDSSERRLWRGDASRQRYLDRAWFAGDTVGLGAAIATYQQVSGVDRWPVAERADLNLTRDFLLAGDLKQARERLRAFRAAVPKSPNLDGIDVEARLLVAEGRPREALAILAPALEESRRWPNNGSVDAGRAWLALGQRDSARVYLSRFADSRDPRQIFISSQYRPVALQLLCDLADTPAQRREWCAALATEWKDADALLQPIVAKARAKASL